MIVDCVLFELIDYLPVRCMRRDCMRKTPILFSNLVQDLLRFKKIIFSVSTSVRSYCSNSRLAAINGELDHSPERHLLGLLESCSKDRSLAATKCFHAFSITTGSVSDKPLFIRNNIMSFYISADEVFDALKLFDRMPERNVVSYSTMIGGLSRAECVDMAVDLFCEMRFCGYSPTQFTFGGLLSCPTLDIFRARQLHALAVKNGFLYVDAFTGTALLGLLGRNGSLDEAVELFEDMPRKSLITWNSLITLLGRYQFVEESFCHFREIFRKDVGLSESSFVGVLSGIQRDPELGVGRQLHGLAIKHGFDSALSVSNSILSMYLKCLDMSSVQRLFRSEEAIRDVVSWNTIISSFAKSETQLKAIELFSEMCAGEIVPNHTTFTSVINSCAKSQSRLHGELMHAKTIRIGLHFEAHVGSALVDFYSRVSRVKEARSAFDDISEKNVVSWNSLIAGYSGNQSSAVLLVKEMLRQSFSPNEFTLSAVLKSLPVSELQQLHCLVIRMGYHHNDYVSSSLITSYAKNEQLTDALYLVTASTAPRSAIPANVAAAVYNRTGQYQKTQEMICSIEGPDNVSWNILIAACLQNGNYTEGFELFRHMQVDGIYYDNYTIVSLLCACTNLCNLALGSSIHGLLMKTCFESCDIFVCNVLMDMYGKCGSVVSSMKVFNQMTDRNLISWTAIISNLGLHGYAHEAIKMFIEMESSGFKPNGATFFVLLTACKHGGLVKEGMDLFRKMESHVVQPDMGHYRCVVELLARHGFVKEAEQVICNMPFPPDALVWRSFLYGCRIQRTAECQANSDYGRCASL
uniref:Pentatricopeptide repeat-containing protein n=1 Tax=Kalanchoe fedtschenkoi TaxID=63787 RepID=A0A7N0VLD5_KALFE